MKKIKIIDAEDNRTFGELWLIVGAVMITKYFDKMLSDNLSWIIYLGVGFLFVLWGARLIRKSER